MTYADESLALARSLARLLDAGAGELDHVGYQQALLARAATLTLAQQIHSHVAGTRKPLGPSTAATLEADAVAQLSRALADHPHVTGPSVAPSSLLGEASNSAAGREWRRAAGHAIVSAHDWTAAAPRRWTPAAAWTAMADAAALAEGIARLNDDLAAAALSLGRVEDADRLAAASVSGLRTAAAEVGHLARSGPLEAGATEREARERRPVLPVQDVTDLPTAQAQLVHLLRAAPHLRPEHAAQVAIGQARGARTVAQLLREAPATDAHRQDLLALANALDGVVAPLLAHTSTPGATASLHRGDPRPVQQAGELVRRLGQQRTPLRAHQDLQALVGYAQQVPEVARTLSLATIREASAGRWLVRSRGDAAAWVPSAPGVTAPPLLDALRDATAAAGAVTAAAERLPLDLRMTGAPRLPAVWIALTAALTARPPARPDRPSVRPTAATTQNAHHRLRR